MSRVSVVYGVMVGVPTAETNYPTGDLLYCLAVCLCVCNLKAVFVLFVFVSIFGFTKINTNSQR